MEIFGEQTQIGDYIISACLKETATTRTWSAKQVSVGRSVLIDELKPEAAENRDIFLTDVRTKAAVEHPLVGSIYEASADTKLCFFAYELLPGETVAALVQKGQKFKAQRFVQLLRRIAEANIYHETHRNATSPLGPENIHVDEQGIVRIQNLAIHGECKPEQSSRDILNLGTFFQPLLDSNYPGATRCLTLLAWMRGEQIQNQLTWPQIRDYCEQIEQQLTEPIEMDVPPTSAISSKKKNHIAWITVASLIMIAIGLVFTLSNKKTKAARSAEVQQEWIAIPAGNYSLPGGSTFKVSAFSISNQEVTINEYAKFLQTLELLTQDSNHQIFDHPEQPPEKTSHKPDDWDALYECAVKLKPWKKSKINRHNPVVGIDWWDAYAFAKWQKCALPTQEQWDAALVSGSKEPIQLPVSSWLPVTEKTPDLTPSGMHAMAGSVSEWTAEPRVSPSNPLGKPLWIIAGGSYLNPQNGAFTKEWIDDRSIRRPDLGFRICKPSN